MTRSEANIQNDILIALSKAGATVFRNNTGMGWVGMGLDGKPAQPCRKVMQVTVYPGDVVIRNARPLHAGLVKGGSDIIGWNACGLFTAVEVKKTTGRATEDQLRFIEAVRAKGGRAGVARSVDDALRILEG